MLFADVVANLVLFGDVDFVGPVGFTVAVRKFSWFLLGPDDGLPQPRQGDLGRKLMAAGTVRLYDGEDRNAVAVSIRTSHLLVVVPTTEWR